MASFNRVIMMGNLTRDPETKQLASGQTVCRLGLASNRTFRNRQSGELVQEVCFVDIDVWGAQADSCAQYLKKGRGILVEGRLKLDSWQDPDGQRRSKHSVVADRVTFMGQGTDEAGMGSGEPTPAPRSTVSPATEAASKKAVKPKSAAQVTVEPVSSDAAPKSGEIAFNDQKPFEDDLPF